MQTFVCLLFTARDHAKIARYQIEHGRNKNEIAFLYYVFVCSLPSEQCALKSITSKSATA